MRGFRALLLLSHPGGTLLRVKKMSKHNGQWGLVKDHEDIPNPGLEKKILRSKEINRISNFLEEKIRGCVIVYGRFCRYLKFFLCI